MWAVFLIMVVVGGCSAARLDGSDACPSCASADGRPGDDDIHPIDAGSPDAAVAPCIPSAWSLETVTQWTDDTANLAPQLRITDAGLVEIDYPTSPQAGWGGPRRAARRALDGAWTITETPSEGRGRLARFVAIDGTEYVCHERLVDPGVEELVCDERGPGGAWTTSVVDPDVSALAEVTGALAPDGTLHLTYIDTGYASIHAWRAPGGTWSSEPIGGTGRIQAPIAIDVEGCIHIARHQSFGSWNRVEHAVGCPDGDWEIEPVDQNPGFPWFTHASMAIDAGGTVHLLYVDGDIDGTMHLRLARRAVGGAWSVDVLDDEPSPTRNHSYSIALDPAGRTWIAYLRRVGSFTSEVVSLVIAPDGTRTRSALDTSIYGGSTTLVVDATGMVHVAFDVDAKRLVYGRACPATGP